ncbi:MAG: PhoH family protein [Phycisphaeraceae bacterium]|nr:PhoH family protein [Phycisphaeraceae bacterium]MBX3406575.1 PhoH family protein [Phycisphaeraceae bacterium]
MEFSIQVPQGAERVTMLGLGDRNLKMLREALGVRVSAREGRVSVEGEREAVAAARSVLERMAAAAGRHEHLSRQQVMDLLTRAMSGTLEDRRARRDNDETDLLSGPAWGDHLDVYVDGRQVRAKTPNQQVYLDTVRDHDLTFGIGPAGTGKTYLAVAAAVHLLRAERVRKVILCRPAVEAGERLGFLPGDLQAKVNPYLRPLLDALHDMMDFATIKRFMFNDVVEVIPLAYMRGRTLNNAAIILDEAQNTTRGQMQMFLTRMGHRSKMIVTGDVTQIDLPEPTESGLIDAARRLRRVRGIGMVQLGQEDIVRHSLVQRIVEAYGGTGGVAGRVAESAESGPSPEQGPITGGGD